jgi:ABC-2 type transport system ATP-binding protein
VILAEGYHHHKAEDLREVENMINANVQARVEEIEEFVASNQLSSAVKRLMDLVSDFTNDRSLRNKVLVIRGIYNELREDQRLYKKTNEIVARSTRLKQQILEFISDLISQGHLHAAVLEKRTSYEATGPELEPSYRYSLNGDSARRVKTRFELEKEEFMLRGQGESATNVVFNGTGITKTYESKSIDFTLHPIHLALRLGEITAVVGENASGKTTLLEIVAGLVKNDGGELNYPGLGLRGKPDAHSIRRQIAYVPQRLPYWPGSAADNLHYTAAIRGIKGEKNELEVDFIISRLDLDRYRQAKWHELSGGFKTRFSLAKVLTWHPKLVILDEPLANLDVSTQVFFLQDLRNLADSVANPMSVLVSSQHLHRVESVADNIVFLKDGETLYNGRMERFGDDRDENTFEIGCSLSKERLMDLLEKTDYKSIEVEGTSYIVHTSTDVTNSQFLEVFVEHDVPLDYFRNISKSTRKLFRRQL